jgi:cation diffusion facilitator CzcD-associated flavoprotein CzcO
MYTNLWANTPRDIMTFAEKDFPQGTPAFPFRTQILQYLKEYGKDVKNLVELNKEVITVEKQGRWCLTIRDSREKSRVAVEQFDAVAVAAGMAAIDCLIVGHYDIPLIPNISGIETFPKGKISHAKYFRHPSSYRDKNILLVGNGPSGADLSNQILQYAHLVRRSVRSEANSLAVTNPKVRDVAALKHFTKDSIELVDGTKLEDIDNVIFCTGYLYSLSMFPKEAGFITSDGSYVHKLYQQTFYVEDPSLVFMGLPKQVIPFPTFQNQAIVVAKVWAQKLSLPSREVMRQDEFARLEKKGFEPTKYHSFKFPEDVELAENWRLWAEQDKSEGWEKSMKPWHWTEERIAYRKRTPEIKGAFLKEIEKAKWDHLQFQRP